MRKGNLWLAAGWGGPDRGSMGAAGQLQRPEARRCACTCLHRPASGLPLSPLLPLTIPLGRATRGRAANEMRRLAFCGFALLLPFLSPLRKITPSSLTSSALLPPLTSATSSGLSLNLDLTGRGTTEAQIRLREKPLPRRESPNYGASSLWMESLR